MKKIIWIYGQSATGKKTLINKLLSGDLKTMKELEMENLKISACKNTIVDDAIIQPSIVDSFNYDDSNLQENNEYFNREIALNRRSCVMTDCLNFLENDDDILLVKGQDNDFWPGRGDIIKYFLEQFSNNQNLKIEVIMLTVQDDELWKKRIQNKEWFKNFEDKESVMNNMIKSRLEQKHEKDISNVFSSYGIPIVFVDSGENHYSIIEKNKIKEK